MYHKPRKGNETQKEKLAEINNEIAKVKKVSYGVMKEIFLANGNLKEIIKKCMIYKKKKGN